MTRRFALLLAFVVAGVSPAFAQNQGQAHPQHPQTAPHHPLQGQMDPAMHALLHGTWTGTVTSSEGSPTKMQLAVATDEQGMMSVKISGDPSLKIGPSTDLKVDEQGLHWTQALAGETCTATAALEGQDPHGPGSLKGKMACRNREIPFALEKTKG